MAFLSAFKNTFFLLVLLIYACGRPQDKSARTAANETETTRSIETPGIVVGANRTDQYLNLVRDKKVAIVANQTSVIFTNNSSEKPAYTHLVDSLLSMGVNIVKVFAPEHGFRGRADAGEVIKDGVDKKSGLAVVSLYGANKKPTPDQLADLDLIVFDIQDVGVRFYTYIATLQLVMEACAEADIPIIVLDRPNPNAHYVDGPTMKLEHRGFLGLTPIPLVYGMTIGEYAVMINEEGWLEGDMTANLTVIDLLNYKHESIYELPIRPSPNLPNAKAVNLYPSMGLFEGTNINAGRGTDFQFQRFGAPFLDSEYFEFSYTPTPNFGAKKPKHKDVLCFGKDVSGSDRLSGVRLQWLIEAYQHCTDKGQFFNTANFTRHAGTEDLQKQIENGKTEEEIKAGWKKDLDAFKLVRAKYLVYP